MTRCYNSMAHNISLLQNIYNRSLSLETRERKHKVPPMKDEANWALFCFGETASSCDSNNDDSMIDGTKELDQNTGGNVSSVSTSVAVAEELEEGEICEMIEKAHPSAALEQDEDASITPENVPMDVYESDDGKDTDLNTVKNTILKEFQLDDGSVFQLIPRRESSKSGFSVAAIDIIQPPIPGFVTVAAEPDAPKEVYEVNVVPTVSLLLQFDQVLTSLLFSYHVKWLESAR